jgi:hypothetical protein
LNPNTFAVFGNEALFAGAYLWVTNGTAAGTSELAVTGAFSQGLFFG